MDFTIQKVYSKNTRRLRPSAWWAIRELPGVVLCRIPESTYSEGWSIVLIAEDLDSYKHTSWEKRGSPWENEDVEDLRQWVYHTHPLPEHCPPITRQTLELSANLSKQLFPTRREALQAIKAAIVLLESE